MSKISKIVFIVAIILITLGIIIMLNNQNNKTNPTKTNIPSGTQTPTPTEKVQIIKTLECFKTHNPITIYYNMGESKKEYAGNYKEGYSVKYNEDDSIVENKYIKEYIFDNQEEYEEYKNNKDTSSIEGLDLKIDFDDNQKKVIEINNDKGINYAKTAKETYTSQGYTCTSE